MRSVLLVLFLITSACDPAEPSGADATPPACRSLSGCGDPEVAAACDMPDEEAAPYLQEHGWCFPHEWTVELRCECGTENCGACGPDGRCVREVDVQPCADAGVF